MKKLMALCMAACLLMVGCGKSEPAPEAPAAPEVNVEAEAPAAPEAEAAPEVEAEPAVTVQPLPDTTMDNLTDATLAVSLEEGDAYLDDNGTLKMDLKIYSYDKYDMVDIANLKVGDIIVTHAGEVEVTAMERSDSGILYINGGLENGGFDLVTGDSGFFFETGFNDMKNWYEVGEATIRVSTEFEMKDNANPEDGEMIYYPGSWLIGEITDYNFTPYNTTIRVEEGQVVAMERIYTP